MENGPQRSTLANLSCDIIKRAGDDSFLEEILKEVRGKVNLMSMVGGLGRPSNRAKTATQDSEFTMQNQSQFTIPSNTNLPSEIDEDLVQIKDLLTPIYPPPFVQNKVNDLVMRYHQTGDSSIVKRALTYYLNNP